MILRENVPIKDLTTMRLGGPTTFVFDVESEDEARGAFTFAEEKSLPVFVLGSGANTIGRDNGFKGVIIRNKIKGIEPVNPDDLENSELLDSLSALPADTILYKAYGGETWDDFVRAVSVEGFTGVEALAAIPGTVGAAPVQNIGAYGQEAAGSIFAVDVYDSVADDYKTLFAEECDFSYRHSIFNSEQKGRYFIIAVYFKLRKGEIESELYASLQDYLDKNNITSREPAKIVEAVTAVRNSKLPDPETIASSGSFFKNIYLDDAEAERVEKLGVPVRRPGNKINTGWLVENCGLKGQDLNGFKICDTAALVLINDHAEAYADLEKARGAIMDAVKDKFGLTLEQEPEEIPEEGINA
ncbi:MAG: FAD-binding protein [Candidatus Saccharibacteria bacterium]|nr:FAD-binding protein [Candidatus Saccharibacteria bacterium]